MKNKLPYESIHFIGIFGSGMSAIAQYLAATGMRVTGSDRLNNSPDTAKLKKKLIHCNCSIYPQDGSGIDKRTQVVCVSTAIEDSNPDIACARALGIPILHRSDILAMLVEKNKSIAIAGTSGKSTVTAMIFELLTACKKSPSLISGAALRSLEEEGMIGNAFYGESDLLIIEADESDGTLVKYKPYISVVLNLSKDHKPEKEVYAMFEQLINQSDWTTLNADDLKLNGLNNSKTFGFNENADLKGIKKKSNSLSSVISIKGVDYTLPIPGDHNASNLLAALSVCHFLGCNESDLVNATANYKGVDRRFAIHHTHNGTTVIDDFAHNPEKIRAAVNAAKQISPNLIVLYQPHGFGPTRFLKDEYATTFREILRPTDKLCLLPIYYAGGTAIKDITSHDIIELMKKLNHPDSDMPFYAKAVDIREDALSFILKTIQKDTTVLLMGARDPSLASFVNKIIQTIDEI